MAYKGIVFAKQHFEVAACIYMLDIHVRTERSVVPAQASSNRNQDCKLDRFGMNLKLMFDSVHAS